MQKFTLTDKIQWVGQREPLDEPPCGYRNEKCSDRDNRLRDSQIAAGVLGSIFIAAVIITLFVYRKWKVEQEIAGLVWKIEPKDILNHQSADGFMDKSTSKVSFSIEYFNIPYVRDLLRELVERSLIDPVDRSALAVELGNSIC